MAALVGKEVPDHIAFVIDIFVKAYNLEVVGIQIRRILVRAALLGVVGRQIMPLLTGQLAATTCRAPRGVN